MTVDPRSQIARMGVDDSAPHAGLLNPDVRSGVSFTFGETGSLALGGWPPFQLVWFYTVDVDNRLAFAESIAAYETDDALATAEVMYRGTYSVTISGALPELEYRTVWGLQSLAAIQDLNDTLNGTTHAGLRSWLDLISKKTVMRAELMGCTSGSLPIVGDGSSAPAAMMKRGMAEKTSITAGQYWLAIDYKLPPEQRLYNASSDVVKVRKNKRPDATSSPFDTEVIGPRTSWDLPPLAELINKRELRGTAAPFDDTSNSA